MSLDLILRDGDSLIIKPDFCYNDGGRQAAGYRGYTGDCGVRAMAIAADVPYQEVYFLVQHIAATKERIRKCKKSHPREGIRQSTYRKWIAPHYGFVWVPCMGVGTGCKVHLRAGELPQGRLILRLSKHYCAFIDGVIHDTYDPSRHGTRCVYGYWKREEG